jgi:hypothetical protein
MGLKYRSEVRGTGKESAGWREEEGQERRNKVQGAREWVPS